MRTFFVAVDESRDDSLFVAEARDKKGRFLGVVSEESRASALEALKSLVLEMLVEFVEQGEHPLECLYIRAPKKGGMDLAFPELFPVILRYQRRKHGMTQSAMANRLDVAQQVYARLERPGKANPTLSTVHRISEILNEELLALA